MKRNHDPMNTLAQFTAVETNRLRRSFLLLIPHIDDVAERFYHALFVAFPGVRIHFMSDLGSQREKLVDTLAGLLDILDHPNEAKIILRELGKRHQAYGATPQIYRWIERTFVKLLAEAATQVESLEDPEVFTDLWPRLMHLVVTEMQRGSR